MSAMLIALILRACHNDTMEERNRNYVELISKNNCGIYQVLEYPDGTVKKYWSCNNQPPE